jgi:hypothetical protein
MKKERYSYLILFVEIAAIVFLHSAKSRQETNKQLSEKAPASSYQLKGYTLTKVK